VPPLCGLRTGKLEGGYLAMIYLGRIRVMNEQKKRPQSRILDRQQLEYQWTAGCRTVCKPTAAR